MEPRLSGVVDRRLAATLHQRLTAFPVVVLTGPRAVGKSTLLQQLASMHGVEVIDFDDLEIRRLAQTDPAAFASGHAPVCIDEFQHVPEILDAIKAELNRRSVPGRYVITGSTRYESLPRTAQSLTGRATIVPIWPLSQGEINGAQEECMPQLLAGDFRISPTQEKHLPREEYASRVLAGGFPQTLALPVYMRTQWFSDYISLVCERDVIALSKVRQRAQLPTLLSRLAAQTGQLLNISEAARSIKLEISTAENYTQLLESVFLIHRLPAWGTTLSSKSGALPKIHVVDTGIAAHLLRITEDKLARRLPQALIEFGHLVETFVVNEILKQVGWFGKPVATGHWRDRGGNEVDLVLEQVDGSVFGIEVKAASRVQLSDALGLMTLAKRLGSQWIGGTVFHTGQHSAALDRAHNILALPIDSLWTANPA